MNKDFEKFFQAILGEDNCTDYERCRKNLSKFIASKVFAETMIELHGDDSDQEKIDSLYKKKLCELSTHDLDLILQTHEEGLFQRREDTVDTIVSELARRALLGDQ